MDAYWEHADCALDAEAVDALLREQAPHLGLGPARYLDEGWSSWAYGASDGRDEWILRFPKRAGVAQALDREFAVLPLIGPRVPLPVPRFAFHGAPSDAYPHRFVGYRSLPGRPALEDLDAPIDATATGAAIGAFLAVLHETPCPELRHVGSVMDDPDDALDQFDRFGADLPAPIVARAVAVLEMPVAEPRERVLCHNDLFTEHILVSERRVSGIIDWGDTGEGDPAEDLAGLFIWMGEAMFEPGLAAYGAARELAPAYLAELRGRARRIAVLRAAADLEYGTRADRADYYGMARRFLERVL